jgi:hypothetical protein
MSTYRASHPVFSKPRRRAAIAATAAILLSTLGAPLASASCLPQPLRPDDGKTYTTDVWRTPGGNIGGQYAKVSEYGPYAGPNHMTRAYVEMRNSSASAIARIGWEETPGFGPRWVFVEWRTGGSWHSTNYGPYAEGTSGYYTLLFQPGVPFGSVRFESRGTLRKTASTGSDVYDTGGVHGSINTLQIQMPGGVNTHETFRDTSTYYSGAWHGTDGTVAYNSSYYTVSKLNAHDYDIWDKACPN